jgi:hypothetical protein
MNKKQWQLKHSLTDQEMEDLEYLIRLFNGKIVYVEDIKHEPLKNMPVQEVRNSVVHVQPQ